MTVVNTIKPLISSSPLFFSQEDGISKHKQRRKGKAGLKHMVKMGTGGTLDPLADGVLVLGVGDGTKELTTFLDCIKEYKATCLLGCETDSYDCEGSRVRIAPWSHISPQKVEDVLGQFRGEIMQTPPIFSALKMNGKPLYEYARKGIPLPHPITPRKVTVHSLELCDWKEGGDHSFHWPEQTLSSSDKENMKMTLKSVLPVDEHQFSLDDKPDIESSGNATRPPVFVLKMKVSGGTYVRSLAHDIGHALGSAAHVVTLTRLRQGDFTMQPVTEQDKGCIPWEVFVEAVKEAEEPEENVQRDAKGLRRWESVVMDNLVLYDNPEKGTRSSMVQHTQKTPEMNRVSET